MLPYQKMIPKTKQDFENDPQQNSSPSPLQVMNDQPQKKKPKTDPELW